MEKEANYELKLPVILHEGDGHFCIVTTDESKKILGQVIVASGDNIKDAETEFWGMLEFIITYHQKRSVELNRWKLFQCGDWGHIGGSWFTLLGLHIYFRHGKGMKGGFYIPLTKMNILFTNYWLTDK